MRYAIFYNRQWGKRDFVSVRSAVRYARLNKIFVYGVYECGLNKIEDAIYQKGDLLLKSIKKSNSIIINEGKNK